MAFSSGTYTLPGPALSTGDTVSATENNTLRNDMASSFNLTWLRNGTAAATANIPMGGYKITGLAAGTTSGDSVRYDEFSAFAANTFGFKNRIINGGMVIDQRNAGASVTPTVDGTYTLDRWQSQLSAASKFSVQRSSTAPAGFSSSMLITSLSAFSLLSGSYFRQAHVIEGFNVADLGWGTANAQAVTVSFWVRSSLTGTFGGALNNSAQNRSYPFTYTISAANTWELKSVNIAGDTSGTWNTDNSGGVIVSLGLGVGSTYSGTAGAWAGATYLSATGATSVVGTNSATFYITGVQLEEGSTATSFDYRPYGTELMFCQRYYWKQAITGASGGIFATATQYSTTVQYGIVYCPVPMRTAPTGAYSSLTDLTYYNSGVSAVLATLVLSTTNQYSSTTATEFNATTSTTFTNGSAGFIRIGGTGWVSYSAEL